MEEQDLEPILFWQKTPQGEIWAGNPAKKISTILRTQEKIKALNFPKFDIEFSGSNLSREKQLILLKSLTDQKFAFID